jgi:hypothetical protein
LNLKEEAMADLDWSKLTPEQKRQYKIDKFLGIEGLKFVSPDAEKAYKIRARRLVDVYSVREPDRVPVNLPLGSLPCLLYGVNTCDAMYDYGKAVEACKRFNEEHSAELEVFAAPRITPGKALEHLDYRLIKWPGHGLARDALGIQFVEAEYMRADEYDAFIRDPSDFWLRTFFPRIMGIFNPFTNLSSLIGGFAGTQLQSLGMPGVEGFLQKMLEASREYRRAGEVAFAAMGQAAAHGFPNPRLVVCDAPFDIVGDILRGTHGIMTDMYRQPDKLLKALDVIADILISSTLGTPGIKDTLCVYYFLHKGSDGWMSPKQFEKFYWPSLRKVMNALTQEGLVQHLFAEGCYNTRLGMINEFPKGFVSWLFDQTDMAGAKKILGDRCCIEGNIPSSLLMTGSPAQVREYCRELIEVCGGGGGYIMAAGAGIENPKLENLRAIMETVREYGVYRKGG